MKSVIIQGVTHTHLDTHFKPDGFTYNKCLSPSMKFICAAVHINLFYNIRSLTKNQLKPGKITIFSFNSAFFIDFFLIISYYLVTKNTK